MTTKKPKQDAAKPEYKLTPQEQTAIDNFLARNAVNLAPRLKVLNEKISLDHPDKTIGTALLLEALGTADSDFLNGLLEHLANAAKQGGQIDERGLNFMVSVVKSVKPRDEIEAMLAAQMAAVHVATMTFARRLAHVETLVQQDSAERAFNKLARTFASQMEALKRYRTGGEQKVTVQHVSVSEGGQAIVGNVTQAPRQIAPDKAAASPAALADSKMPAMTIEGESAPAAVPVKRKRRK